MKPSAACSVVTTQVPRRTGDVGQENRAGQKCFGCCVHGTPAAHSPLPPSSTPTPPPSSHPGSCIFVANREKRTGSRSCRPFGRKFPTLSRAPSPFSRPSSFSSLPGGPAADFTISLASPSPMLAVSRGAEGFRKLWPSCNCRIEEKLPWMCLQPWHTCFLKCACLI